MDKRSHVHPSGLEDPGQLYSLNPYLVLNNMRVEIENYEKEWK